MLIKKDLTLFFFIKKKEIIIKEICFIIISLKSGKYIEKERELRGVNIFIFIFYRKKYIKREKRERKIFLKKCFISILINYLNG